MMLLLILRLIVATMHGQLVIGPTYAAAEWSCGRDWPCYLVVSWADGVNRPLVLDYEVSG